MAVTIGIRFVKVLERASPTFCNATTYNTKARAEQNTVSNRTLTATSGRRSADSCARSPAALCNTRNSGRKRKNPTTF